MIGSQGEIKDAVLTQGTLAERGTKQKQCQSIRSQWQLVFTSRRNTQSVDVMERDRKRSRVQTSRDPRGATEREPHRGTNYLLMKTKTNVWTRHGAGTGGGYDGQHELCTGSANSFEQSWQCEGEHQGRGTGDKGQGW